MIAVGRIHVGASVRRPNVVWMDERPLEPGRLYLLKHARATATARSRHAAGAERDRHACTVETVATAGLRSATPRTARTGSFILIDPATTSPPAPGMILRRAARGRRSPASHRAAERLARPRARAATDAEAIEAVRRLLEHVLEEMPDMSDADRARRRRARRRAEARASPRASRPSASCSCTCCARSRRTFPCCFSTPCTTSRRRSRIATSWPRDGG